MLASDWLILTMLTSDWLFSAGPGAVQARAGADYYQRGPCIECEY